MLVHVNYKPTQTTLLPAFSAHSIIAGTEGCFGKNIFYCLKKFVPLSFIYLSSISISCLWAVRKSHIRMLREGMVWRLFNQTSNQIRVTSCQGKSMLIYSLLPVQQSSKLPFFCCTFEYFKEKNIIFPWYDTKKV